MRRSRRSLVIAGALDAASRRPLSLAILGMGKIARDQHLPAIWASEHFRLAACIDPSGSLDGVPSFSSLRELIGQGPAVNAIAICTPPAPRAALAREALGAGLDVMLEKPPGTTVASIEELVPFARERGRALFAAWHSRESAAVDAAKHWLSTRTIRSAAIVWREDVRVWHPGQEWIFGRDGFGAFDPGINALSILTTLIGDPLGLVSADFTVPQGREAPIAVRLSLATPNNVGVQAAFDLAHTGEERWTIDIETDAGRLTLADGGTRLIVDGVEQATPGSMGEYPRLYRRFATLIESRASDVDLRPLALVEAAWSAARITAAPPFCFA